MWTISSVRLETVDHIWLDIVTIEISLHAEFSSLISQILTIVLTVHLCCHVFYILLMQSKSVILFTLIHNWESFSLMQIQHPCAWRADILGGGDIWNWHYYPYQTEVTAISGCTVMYSIYQVVCPSYASPTMYSEQFHLDPHVQRRSMSTSLIVLYIIDHGVLTSVYSYRVIHAMRTWLSNSFDDFKDERLRKKLQEFLKIVQMWVNHLKFSFMQHVHVRCVP